MAHESWEEDYRDFMSNTLAYLKLHGLMIGAKSRDVDVLCKRIAEHYGMLYRSFDPMTHSLLKADIAAYDATHLTADPDLPHPSAGG